MKNDFIEVPITHVRRTYMNLDEAALYLDVSISTMYKYVNKKLITYYKPNGRRLYFLQDDLDGFIFSKASLHLCIKLNEKNLVKSNRQIEEEAISYFSERKGDHSEKL